MWPVQKTITNIKKCAVVISMTLYKSILRRFWFAYLCKKIYRYIYAECNVNSTYYFIFEGYLPVNNFFVLKLYQDSKFLNQSAGVGYK